MAQNASNSGLEANWELTGGLRVIQTIWRLKYIGLHALLPSWLGAPEPMVLDAKLQTGTEPTPAEKGGPESKTNQGKSVEKQSRKGWADWSPSDTVHTHRDIPNARGGIREDASCTYLHMCLECQSKKNCIHNCPLNADTQNQKGER